MTSDDHPVDCAGSILCAVRILLLASSKYQSFTHCSVVHLSLGGPIHMHWLPSGPWFPSADRLFSRCYFPSAKIQLRANTFIATGYCSALSSASNMLACLFLHYANQLFLVFEFPFAEIAVCSLITLCVISICWTACSQAMESAK